MPRLRDRRVLDEGIVDMPMLWDTDAFALATGFNNSADRYIGLWISERQGQPHPPLLTPSCSCGRMSRSSSAKKR